MTEPLPRSRGTVFVQVLVAVLFLAVIGGSVGLVLGLNARDRDNQSRGGGPGTSTTDDGGPTQPGSVSAPSTRCPDRAAQGAGRDLEQVLNIRTELSEVWICSDRGGALYYQGHRFSDDGWLFLPSVERKGDEYVATNVTPDEGTIVYRVSAKALVIEYPDGRKPETQPVVPAR